MVTGAVVRDFDEEQRQKVLALMNDLERNRYLYLEKMIENAIDRLYWARKEGRKIRARVRARDKRRNKS
jgi:hypothetical protein